MHTDEPSRTAMRVAVRRAAHQILDSPRVFEDSMALAILGSEAVARLKSEIARGEYTDSPTLRAFLAARSRCAEDELSHALERGVRQYVVLGAGLDTFACRNRYAASGLRVFEVDYPSTQAWKRDRLRAAGIEPPSNVVFVPVDFEHDSLGDTLQTAGLHPAGSAFFSWLGVTPYLTDTAFAATLTYIAAMPPGSGVVFDYAAERSTLSPADQIALDALAARVARAGEPFRLYLSPAALAGRLYAMGFRQLEDLGTVEINSRYFAGRTDGLHLRGGGGHLLSARL